MRTTKRAVLIATMVALAVYAAACGSTDADSGTSAPTPTPTVGVHDAPTTPTSPPTSTPRAGEPPSSGFGPVNWSDPSVVVDLGDGWTIAACEGGAAMLCVSRDGEFVGNVEALRFPLESFDVVDPTADAAANLRAIAVDFLAAMELDRAGGCGSDYDFEQLPVADFAFDGRPGITYGFVGRTAGGGASELNIQFAAIDGGDLVLIATIAYDEGGCPGRDDTSGFDSASLEVVSDRIAAVLAVSVLPMAV